jgi:hypothetical protein
MSKEGAEEAIINTTERGVTGRKSCEKIVAAHDKTIKEFNLLCSERRAAGQAPRATFLTHQFD